MTLKKPTDDGKPTWLVAGLMSLTTLLAACESGNATNSSDSAPHTQREVTTVVNGGAHWEPASLQVIQGEVASFTLVRKPGYEVLSVSGCDGNLEGEVFTTGAITADCTVNAELAAILPGEPERVININDQLSLLTTNATLGVRLGSYAYFVADDGVHGNELWRTNGTSTRTHLVADIHPGLGSAKPEELTVFGKKICFSADDGNHGRELWCSDGTSAGTYLVANIQPGSGGSHPMWLTVWEDVLYFSADDGTHGRELWRSDGTEEGTYQVRDIRVGREGSEPQMLAALEDHLVFSADDGIHGRELWRSEGDALSTVLVRDILDGSNSGIGPASVATQMQSPAFAVHEDALYFRARNSHSGYELWRSGGTFATTQMVRNLNNEGSSFPMSLHSTPLGLMFNAETSDGYQLYITDGSFAGTQSLKDGGSGQPVGVPEHGSWQYFAVGHGSNAELWRTDGAIEGTTPVPLPESSPNLSDIRMLTHFNGNLYFRARQGQGLVNTQLYYYDGESIHLIEGAVAPGYFGFLTDLTPLNGQLLFIKPSLYSNSISQSELWSLSADHNSTQLSSLNSMGASSWPRVMGELNGQLVFSAESPIYGRELWHSDGTEAGTGLLANAYIDGGSGLAGFDGGGQFGGPMKHPVIHQAYLYYVARSFFGDRLWRTDGTVSGTHQVADVCAVVGCDMLQYNPSYFQVSADDYLYFKVAGGGGSTSRLWRTDGSTVGTEAVAVDLELPGRYWEVEGPTLAAIGDRVFFQAEGDDDAGKELWTLTSGSEPQRLTNINDEGDSNPQWLTPIGSELFFVAENSDSEQELWVTEGTVVSTRRVVSADTATNPMNLTEHQGLLFFSSFDENHGQELWRSDGSAEGTYRVHDIHEGPHSSHPSALTSTSLGLVFVAFTPDTGSELWVSDGTAENTQLLMEVIPGSPGGVVQTPGELPSINGVAAYDREVEIVDTGDGRVVFRGCDPDHGCQLWITDGTAMGSFRMTEFGSAPAGASPGFITVFNDYLYFAATDNEGERELWRLELPR